MSVLSRFSKDQKDIYTYPLTTRVSDRTAQRFQAHCNSCNLSVSEAIRLLIENEIDKNPAAAPLARMDPAAAQKAAASKVQAVKKSRPAPDGDPDPLFPSSFKIDNRQPCPICQDWSYYSGFSKRHTQKHGFESTADFYAAYRDTVIHMYKEKSRS